MASSAADLAVSLLKTASSPDEDFFFSPSSIASALLLIHEGARNETKKESTKFLDKGGSLREITNYYTQLTSNLNKPKQGPPKDKWERAQYETEVEIFMANRMYIDTDFNVKNDYRKRIETRYKAEIEKVNMGDTKGTAKKMNDFVEERTDGMITDFVSPQCLTGSVTVLINAVSFTGTWDKKFDGTKKKLFRGVRGNRKGFVNRSSFLIVKPLGNFTKWREGQSGEKLRAIISGMNKCYINNVEVPEFKMETEFDVGETLKELGVKRIFGGAADLSAISNVPGLCVSSITHKAVIEVDTEGTRAAAATKCVCFGSHGQRPQEIDKFVADRPFLYVISYCDDAVFMGQFV